MNLKLKMFALASVIAITILPSTALEKSISKKKVVVTTYRKTIPLWSKGLKVPHRAWLPVERPKQVLLCVHGLGFSSESFLEFGRAMAGHGMAVYAVDVRGFGQWIKSSDKKVDFEACLLDVEAALRNLHKAYGTTPIFLVGESMGGGIALQATSRNPQLVYGLICSVPSSDRYSKFSSEIIVGTRYLENKDKPMDMTAEVVKRATSDTKLRKAWANESSNRMKLTPKELKQFTDFMKGNEDAAALIDKTPSLMIAGFKDKLVKPEGTIDLFNELNTPDKLLMVVGDGEHLLLEENQMTDQLEQMVLVWIKNESTAKQRGINSRLSEGK
ncbi:MAG: alpha/beta fold hydrolase [Candidatus Melainabacteria bacterium]|nr:alpha/beta fold hydrolase [Candidatus Melainabacteria bacterium]